jgi:hypothetical protein
MQSTRNELWAADLDGEQVADKSAMIESVYSCRPALGLHSYNNTASLSVDGAPQQVGTGTDVR